MFLFKKSKKSKDKEARTSSANQARQISSDMLTARDSEDMGFTVHLSDPDGGI